MPCYSHDCTPTTQQIHWLLSYRCKPKKGQLEVNYRDLAGVGARLKDFTHRSVTTGIEELQDLDVLRHDRADGNGIHWLTLWVPCECLPKTFFCASDLRFISPPVSKTGCVDERQFIREYSRTATSDPATTMRRMLRKVESRIAQSPGMEESVHSLVGTDNPTPQRLTTVYLARYYFAGLCYKHNLGFLNGADSTLDWPKLARQLGNWKRRGIELTTIRDMMDEFALHPEWSKSSTAPWKMFLAKHHELAKAVSLRQQRGEAENRDPAAWGGIRRPKTNAPAPS